MWVFFYPGARFSRTRATFIFFFFLVILSLQQPSGVFAGDSFGETDTRFLFCAVNALSLVGRLSDLDIDKTVSYLQKCKNFDGGYGSSIGAESHAAQGKHFNRTESFICYFRLKNIKSQCSSVWLHSLF
jgi:geranylgeranyl transferase type-2 subunit beta